MGDKQDQVRIPPRYSRVDPWVISPDADAEITFLTKVFDAKETPGSRMLDPEGRIGHVEVEIGSSVIMMFDARPEWPALPSHLRVYVKDAKETFEKAIKAGAQEITKPTELAFGERVARVRDAQGHVWWIHERVEDVSPNELAARFADPKAQEALSYVRQTLTKGLSEPVTKK